jgi:hypothetical protein
VSFNRSIKFCPTGNTNFIFPELLKHSEAIIDLYLHEIAMHHSHNIDDFRPPYGVEEVSDETPDYITPAHIDSLTICLDSIHKAFDAFIEMPLSTLRALPTLFFVRNSYAAVALVKMYTAVSAKGSKFGSVFKPKDLKVEYYLDKLVEIMQKAAEGNQSRVAQKFSFILSMLRNWQAKRSAGLLTKQDKGMLSERAMSAGWDEERNRQLQQQKLGKNPQDPKSTSWNSGAANANAKPPQHSGLHMLSEAAMGNNLKKPNPDTSTSDPAAAAGAALAATSTSSQPPWDSQLAAYADMNQQPQQQNMMAAAGGDPFTQGYMSDLDNFALTAEELGALGSMMDDPGWLNFGLESSGWAM